MNSLEYMAKVMNSLEYIGIAAATHIVDLIEARGPQELYQLKVEVYEQTIGVDKSNADKITDLAIANLIRDGRIEKVDDVDTDDKPYTYYDIPF
jgi:hypothetical protein